MLIVALRLRWDDGTILHFLGYMVADGFDSGMEVSDGKASVCTIVRSKVIEVGMNSDELSFPKSFFLRSALFISSELFIQTPACFCSRACHLRAGGGEMHVQGLVAVPCIPSHGCGRRAP